MPVTDRTCLDTTATKAYAQEQKLLRAYDRLLRAADLDQLITDCFGPKLSEAKRRNADDRLEYAMPDLLRKLRPDQQPPLAELLLGETPDLPAAVRYLAGLERHIIYRDEDPRLLDDSDEHLVKAAGLGKLSKAAYRNATTGRPGCQAHQWASRAAKAPPLGPPLELTPWPPVRFRGVRAKPPRKAALPQCRGQLSIQWPPVAVGPVKGGGL